MRNLLVSAAALLILVLTMACVLGVATDHLGNVIPDLLDGNR